MVRAELHAEPKARHVYARDQGELDSTGDSLASRSALRSSGDLARAAADVMLVRPSATG